MSRTAVLAVALTLGGLVIVVVYSYQWLLIGVAMIVVAPGVGLRALIRDPDWKAPAAALAVTLLPWVLVVLFFVYVGVSGLDIW
jgi:hypothetical protein